MAATPATIFGTLMTKLKNNAGGNVQQLIDGNLAGGKVRQFIETLVLAAQANGSVIAVARIPLGSIYLGTQVTTDTTLDTSTIKFGNAGDGNSAIYGAAATLTAVDTPTLFTKTAVHGVAIARGYDSQSGLEVTPYAPGAAGADYEEIIMTVGVADLPAAGNLRIAVIYIPPES